jgi:hypothetical protein
VTQAGQGIAPISQSLAAAGSQPVTAASTLGNVSQYMDSTTPALKAAQGIGAIQGSTGGVGGIPASGGANGILDFIGKNPTLVGSVLSSIGAGGSQVNSKDLQKEVNAQIDLRNRSMQLAYGGAYAGKPDPFGIGNTSYLIPQPRYYYDPNTKQVVDRQAQGA